MRADQPLTWSQMCALFERIADRLDPQVPVDIVIAGGSSLAYFGIRNLTVDVDVVSEIPEALTEQIVRMANEHDLAADWMNNHARSFRPEDADTDVIVFSHGPLNSPSSRLQRFQ